MSLLLSTTGITEQALYDYGKVVAAGTSVAYLVDRAKKTTRTVDNRIGRVVGETMSEGGPSVWEQIDQGVGTLQRVGRTVQDVVNTGTNLAGVFVDDEDRRSLNRARSGINQTLGTANYGIGNARRLGNTLGGNSSYGGGAWGNWETGWNNRPWGASYGSGGSPMITALQQAKLIALQRAAAGLPPPVVTPAPNGIANPGWRGSSGTAVVAPPATPNLGQYQ